MFHVSAHGRGARHIFLDDRDRASFLRTLGCAVYRFRWICCGYCLMGTHYHLIVDACSENLSAGMQMLNSVHTCGFNARHARTGPLMRVHFMSKRIDDDHRLMNAVKYIARNPVDAKLCEHPGDWEWSSYCATAGIVPVPAFLDAGPVLALFSRDERTARNAFIDFVSGSCPEVEREVRSRYYTRELLATNKVRERQRPTLATLFEVCDSMESRNCAVREAHLLFGYTLKEIGRHLGLSESMISRVCSAGVKDLNDKLNNR